MTSLIWLTNETRIVEIFYFSITTCIYAFNLRFFRSLADPSDPVRILQSNSSINVLIRKENLWSQLIFKIYNSYK